MKLWKQKERYIRIHECVNCQIEMSNNTKMYSNGVCPNCGNVGSPTICRTRDKSVKIRIYYFLGFPYNIERVNEEI